ncbi:MAG: flagellar biosynthetic protein FliO [Chloroflexi bacterium]|nr:flagellar biosynthetic protein FliO [Chloroflexota bacterium]
MPVTHEQPADPAAPPAVSGEPAAQPNGASAGVSAARAAGALAPAAEFWRSVSWREPRTAGAQIVAQFGMAKLAVAGALLVLVLGAFLLPGSVERGDPFDGPGAAMDLVLKLGAVLALAYVSMAALKRYTAGSISQRGTLLEVLDSTTLGPNRSVYVVRAGGKRLVLGVTQNQITPLGELDETPPA